MPIIFSWPVSSVAVSASHPSFASASSWSLSSSSPSELLAPRRIPPRNYQVSNSDAIDCELSIPLLSSVAPPRSALPPVSSRQSHPPTHTHAWCFVVLDSYEANMHCDTAAIASVRFHPSHELPLLLSVAPLCPRLRLRISAFAIERFSRTDCVGWQRARTARQLRSAASKAMDVLRKNTTHARQPGDAKEKKR